MEKKNKKIRVGMILDRDFPPDARPEKEAISLIEAGYEVFILGYTWQGRPKSEIYKGIHLTRFVMSRKVQRKLSPTYLALPFYRWIWHKQIDAFVKDNNIDIIHVHDLPLTDIAHKVAKKYGCKVVCDQHEYWSNWIVNTAHYNTKLGKIVKALSNWKKYEKENLLKADMVITVTDPLKECYLNEVGVAPHKIVTVPNTPSRDVFKKENVDPTIVQKYKDDFVLIYAGVMDVLRGVEVMIRALPEMEKHIPNIKVLLVGRFSKNCNPLKLAEELGVAHRVEYTGWVEHDLLPSYMAASSICLFTPFSNHGEINNTIATKIYQYLAMHKPIITSDAKMMYDFVVNNKIGYAIDPNYPKQLEKVVVDFYNNFEKENKRIITRCKHLIEHDTIFWDQTVKEMVHMYKKLL